MNYSSNDEARYWAEKLAASEAEAFEKALKREKPDDIIRELEDDIKRLQHENKTLKEDNRKLREALYRATSDNYEYE